MLNKYIIETSYEDYRHPHYAWQACWNGFDLDVKTGEGPTEKEAMLDLIEHMGLPTAFPK